MLIDFELTPVEDVVPWGAPGNHSLTWFGLTEGRYWINAGADTLFEYSEHARRNEADRNCDYYVARIFEDLANMLPAVLEVVPPDLRKYVSGNAGREWIETCEFWSGQYLDEDAGNEAWDVADRAASLFRERLLDTGYLSPSASIVIWSDETDVHIEWDNRDRFIDGALAWSATNGSFQLPREQFVTEVEVFHTRLLAQMTSRIDQVAAGALRPDIHIDVPGLIAENEQFRRALAQALAKGKATSWEDIRSAISRVSSGTASMPG